MSLLVNLEHTIDEVNSILLALSKRPYEEVSDLINKIRGSASQQIAASVPAPAPAPAPAADPEPAADPAPVDPSQTPTG